MTRTHQRRPACFHRILSTWPAHPENRRLSCPLILVVARRRSVPTAAARRCLRRLSVVNKMAAATTPRNMTPRHRRLIVFVVVVVVRLVVARRCRREARDLLRVLEASGGRRARVAADGRRFPLAAGDHLREEQPIVFPPALGADRHDRRLRFLIRGLVLSSGSVRMPLLEVSARDARRAAAHEKRAERLNLCMGRAPLCFRRSPRPLSIDWQCCGDLEISAQDGLLLLAPNVAEDYSQGGRRK